MDQYSNTVRALEARVRALEFEYARLNERLRTVGAALGGAELPSAQGATHREARMPQRGQQTAAARSTVKAAPSPSAKKPRDAQAGGPRKWFEKGEAVALFRKVIERPMRTRDLMTRVVAAKRKAQLPKEDLERFKWAVHSALKEAIAANSIVRQDDGTIAVGRPPNVRVAAKVARKAR
jgi:hypothetical protein